jgi:cbb3-type cytochrome oxidase cytochrome c subunit
MKMTYATLIGGSLIVFLAVVMAVVFIPGLVWQPPQTFVGHPYSPAEAHGREIFYRNGCNYCHTQYVREWDTASGPTTR